jgi:hypothetical protein
LRIIEERTHAFGTEWYVTNEEQRATLQTYDVRSGTELSRRSIPSFFVLARTSIDDSDKSRKLVALQPEY